MDVKTAARVLDIFEAFASEQKPLTLSDLAKALGIPVSSCFGLVRTLENRGFLYAVRPRGGLYPTKRLLQIARTISGHDPIVERVAPILAALRDATGETSVFGKRQGARVIYLDVADSPHRIRYTAAPGESREMHSNSIGKALLAQMSPEERDAVLADVALTAHTPDTLVTRAALYADVEAGKARGYFCNFGGSVSDVWALGVATSIAGEPYGLSLVGPRHRIEPAVAEHVAHLRDAAQAIAALEEHS